MNYKCIKRLVADEFEDPDGARTGNEFVVEVGEIWAKEEEDSDFLTKEDGSWLDLDGNTLEEHFEKVDE